MPFSPSMNVMALLQDAVLVKPGSYAISPKSSGAVFACRTAIALIVPFVIGSS